MKTNRTRMIGSAIAGTGVAALVVAGMAFGMPSFDEDSDPKLGESARARQQLLQQGAGTLDAQPSDPARAKAGELVLPAQAAAPEAAIVAEETAAAPVVTPAEAEAPASQPSPVAEGQGAWDDDEQSEYEEHEEYEEYEEHEEHEEGDDD